jgi:hypothetical protein
MSKENTKKLQTEYFNTKKMYEMQKETNQNLKTRNKELVERNDFLEKEIKTLGERVEKLELEREELKRMVFK